MNRPLLRANLLQNESLRLKPYKDTAGKWTIGVGRNLTDFGLTQDEAFELMENDIDAALQFCVRNVSMFTTLNDVRQNVIVEMCFNLGGGRLLEFEKMLRAVTAGDFETAAAEMLNSKWAVQVGQRAVRLAAQMRNG